MMGRKHASATVRQCLDSMRDDAEFVAFAEMITNPLPGVTVKRATADELVEIQTRLKRIQR